MHFLLCFLLSTINLTIHKATKHNVNKPPATENMMQIISDLLFGCAELSIVISVPFIVLAMVWILLLMELPVMLSITVALIIFVIWILALLMILVLPDMVMWLGWILLVINDAKPASNNNNYLHIDSYKYIVKYIMKMCYALLWEFHHYITVFSCDSLEVNKKQQFKTPEHINNQ